QRAEGQWTHELDGVRGKRDIDDGSRLHQAAGDLQRLVAGDGSGHAEHDVTTAQGVALTAGQRLAVPCGPAPRGLAGHWFASYTRRSPSRLRLSSIASKHPASSAIIETNPPVPITSASSPTASLKRRTMPLTIST